MGADTLHHRRAQAAPAMPSSRSFPLTFVKGRGAGSNRQSRFLEASRHSEEDGWNFGPEDEEAYSGPGTTVADHAARTIISRNISPDIGFEQSINPYLGCEHGCIYCYARPSHAYLGLSPGTDFETKIFAKGNAAQVLREELSKKAYVPATIALGANTDPYQPTERKLQVTRGVLEVLRDFNAPVSITTKSALVVRDLDVLVEMAAKRQALVNISIATLDTELARTMDPRAPTPARRIGAIKTLAAAGVPVRVFTSPVILGLTDCDLEKILEQAYEAGARHASYVMLRLPREVRDLFVEWLESHFPLRAAHVMSLVAQSSGGKDYDPDFGTRMKGSGVFADLIAQRFRVATRRLGMNLDRMALDCSQFAVPSKKTDQLDLF